VDGPDPARPLLWPTVADPFESYAQNGEDVVLMRAFGDVRDGRYVDVGANDAVHFSISYAFYLRGWRGVTVEPVEEYAEAHRSLRPGDTLVQVAATDADTDTVVLHTIGGTGLSTTVDDVATGHQSHGWAVTDVEVPARRLDRILDDAGFADGPIHFVTVDVEGAEPAVLASIDLDRIRPWVFVVESTKPLTTVATHSEWEHLLTDHGYTATLFDGLSRYYVADEHLEALGPALSYPACVLDDYTDEHERQSQAEAAAAGAEIAALRGELERVEEERDVAVGDLVRWRASAVTRWANAAGGTTVSAADRGAAAELERVKATVSWRVTRPLREVRGRAGALRR
jgi:FkbM family methyltransferase